MNGLDNMPASGDRSFDQAIGQLEAASADLEAVVEQGIAGMTERQLDVRDARLRKVGEAIQQMRNKIDPAKHEIIAISLGRPDALSRFFAFSFVEREPRLFKDIENSRFFGSGVYAIYYVGRSIPFYEPLSGAETPIYVGKAVPEDRSAETAHDQGAVLWKRLKEHRKSMVAGGLDPAEFRYRHAIIQSGMESAVEDFMIRLFKPIWNKEIKICFGIGKHGDSAKTRGNKRSPWDTMHPGRHWANATLQNQASKASIIRKIQNHFADNPAIAGKSDLYGLLSLS